MAFSPIVIAWVDWSDFHFLKTFHQLEGSGMKGKNRTRAQMACVK